MAALDLHCGVEDVHGACAWAGGRVDPLDSFDSEMQEWEEQLQDVQRKIEELYKEVKARRGASEYALVSNHAHLDFTLLPVDAAGGYHGPNRCYSAGGEVGSVRLCGEGRGDLLAWHANAVNHHGDHINGTCDSEAGCHHDGFLCPMSRDVTLNILNGYLGQGEDATQRRRSPGAPHTVMQSVRCRHDGAILGPVPGRIGDVLAGEFEENRKNGGFGPDGARYMSWKDASCPKEAPPERPASKLRQRDVAPPIHIPTRSTHFPELPQQPDRKCSLVDWKCGSPSVLRKFGAMLQENEGKTLIEDGTVTMVISADPSKAPATPVCQRKLGAGRVSAHVPGQKCPQDPEVWTAGVETSQEPRAVAGSRTMLQSTGEHRGLPRKPPVSPAPRAGVQTGLWGPQGLERLAECMTVDRTLTACAGSQYQGKGQDSRGLWDSVKREEQGTAAYSVQQNCREPSPVQGRRSFSRPARPANQRPPSRWASHTPTAKISTPSGPQFHPPSPAHKAKQSFSNYSLYTETVIM
ncbi:uncharacterized protein LOC113590879 [Electrophorus electricus]|uniref:uncharacterized protein LOC113590879 n=1 Tax=Electrophorus electricus TaxID=8005 RepID=UPI0015D05CEC|nr:uncharacterized protein LOC113590879 [Electrophorus electricus]XP_026887009.2 uncharacterized protein LOC113590879 [Electrophorus electricus]XP_026887011.2 uncharacterized protein LOC113590879 [Electrophorus electricus]